jgi:pilus assembly protein TadC
MNAKYNNTVLTGAIIALKAMVYRYSINALQTILFMMICIITYCNDTH